MVGDVKMQTIKLRTGRSLTGYRPLFLALRNVKVLKHLMHLTKHFKIIFACKTKLE